MPSEPTTPDQACVALVGRFSWPRLALWLPASVFLGAVAAWVAVLAQAYFAPWLIFPLLVGIGLGAALVGLLRFAQVGHRPTILCGTVLAAAVAVVGQHYLHYRLEQRVRQPSADDYLVPAEVLETVRSAESFLDFLERRAARGSAMWWGQIARGWQAWLLWGIDALLVLGTTVAMTAPALRQPYCIRCESWYRTMRSGRVSLATARRLAQQTDVSIGAAVRSARYRLSCCHGGCGPTRFELSWEEPDGSTFLSLAWLDARTRGRVMQELDESSGATGEDSGPRPSPPPNLEP